MNDELDIDKFLEQMFAVGLKPVVITDAEDEEAQAPSSSFYKDQDGVWTLVHCGVCLGWINRVTGDVTYRALSKITNSVEHFYSLESARNYLFSQSH